MRTLCVIPSRWGSTRLHAKALQLIGDRPMVVHVWQRANEARVFDRVIVATDDVRIRNAVIGFGGEAMMTSRALKSGTDRVAVVARRVPLPLVVNLQGDEPFISPAALAGLVRAMRADPACPFGTIARRVRWADIASNPNAVKIVTDARGRAIYFSRAPVPFDWTGRDELLQHLGVYAYRRAFLMRFARMPRSALEHRERLEQLRVLEYGIRPKVVVTETPALSIDTPHDLQRAREWLTRRRRRRAG
ncbi:MAG: 3-deoxy-manno-octulosonate cytidylyltransferase [Candidatus Coatesbacteria bacterium]